MPRRKTVALPVPQSLDEAIALVERYVGIGAVALTAQEDAEAAIARIRGEADRLTKPLEQEGKDILRQLERWWAVSAPAMVKKGQRSTKLAGCTIGIRRSTPRLDTGNHTAKEMIATLRASGWAELVREKLSLDKQAIIKTLGGEHAARLEAHGLRIKQTDEFFIDRPPPKAPSVEIVEGEEA